MGTHIAGGYFVTRAVDRPDHTSADLLPSRLISASDCIVDFAPDEWAMEEGWVKTAKEEREKEAEKWGISGTKLQELTQWVTARMDDKMLGWPNVCLSLKIAREFIDVWLPDKSEYILIGIGLPEEFVDELLEEEKPSHNQGVPGIYTSIGRRRRIEAGGNILGYEILGYELGGFHSWLCNHLEKEIFEKLKIRPNANGFIESLEEARTCAEYCSREEIGAEPVLWQPWLITRYSAE